LGRRQTGSHSHGHRQANIGIAVGHIQVIRAQVDQRLLGRATGCLGELRDGLARQVLGTGARGILGLLELGIQRGVGAQSAALDERQQVVLVTG